MPIYEYKCCECCNVCEKLVRSPEDDAPPECPCCGGSTEKVFSVCCSHGGERAPAGSAGASCPTCSGGSCSTCGR